MYIKNLNYRKYYFFSMAISLLMLLGLSPSSADDYTKTKYPVVLSHGLSWHGNDSTAPVTDGWYGITSSLSRSGTIVFEPDTSAFNSSTVRGEQLLKYLLELQAIYGYQKFNLIGHSQGGLDIRYVASVRPEIVASVTAVSSPAHGSGFADAIVDLTSDHPIVVSLIAIGMTLTGYWRDPNDPQDGFGAVNTITSKGALSFASEHPQGMPEKWCGEGQSIVDDVRYYSFSGNKSFTNFFDASDYQLAATGLLFGDQNDGLVGRCSSHLGKVIKDNYSWNHQDSVNQTNGLIGWGSASPVEVYRTHVNRLKRKNL